MNKTILTGLCAIVLAGSVGCSRQPPQPRRTYNKIESELRGCLGSPSGKRAEYTHNATYLGSKKDEGTDKCYLRIDLDNPGENIFVDDDGCNNDVNFVHTAYGTDKELIYTRLVLNKEAVDRFNQYLSTASKGGKGLFYECEIDQKRKDETSQKLLQKLEEHPDHKETVDEQ
ncbi:MAG: hypothetical protein WCV90_07845 [Candidatus Woesearchaeota archaeon]|jgi:hypothetical protein